MFRNALFGLQEKNIYLQSKSNRRETADLHMHTTYSDGVCSPFELIDFAHKKGVHTISITDHDNLESYDIAKTYAAEKNVQLIPGIEISAVWNTRDIHILGYFCDSSNLTLNLALKEQAKRRKERLKLILKKLEAMGVNLSYEKVISYSQDGSIGRPHIAQALLDEEYVKTFQEAFQIYLGDDAGAYVERKGISVEQTIRLIQQAGGVAVLAHPMRSKCDEIIPDMVEWGLAGIETYCYSQKGAAARKYSDLAKRYNIVGAGGSDFHTPQGACHIGDLKMPVDVIDSLYEKLGSQKAQNI